MEIIRLPGYTEVEKQLIAQQFLIRKQRTANGLAPENIQFSENAILTVIRQYTREAGVRNLEREIASICRKVAREVASKGKDHQVKVGSQAVAKYLGVPKYRFGRTEEADEIGLTTGLAWTEFGGELLQTEVVVLPGRGKLLITGKLGEVMQESAQAALSYVRSKAQYLGLPAEFYRNIDIHVHVPEGAIPKDGPSAGITIATSIVSALLKIPVRREVAMTGEITLRGRVLPIGGLKEKIIAAHRHQIKTVLIPRDNEKDIKEIPSRILKAVDLVSVEHMDEVLKKALALDDPESLFKAPPMPAPEPAFLPAEVPGVEEIQAH
jgi:ATP-dependent Lon protease